MILFNASDIIEIEFAIIPITSFTIESKILTTIPVALESIPYFPLVFKLPTSLSFMNNFINNLSFCLPPNFVLNSYTIFYFFIQEFIIKNC